jgi:transposase
VARRRFLVRDIAEILEHWQAGRSICAISRSLGVSRPTVRKYVYAVEARGYHQGDPTPSQGWKAFISEVIPKPPDPTTRSEVFAQLLPYQEEIRTALATTKAATIWQRLRDEKKIKVSQPSFYRYLSCFLADVWKQKPIITVRRDDPPPGEEVQIDFGYLGIWQDPKSGKKCRLWAFAMILSFSRHMFIRVVTNMDQREWLTCHILAFEFFGGVPLRIIPDNLKTGILKADLYDPQFNPGYAELAHHYGTIIDPARSGKPKDKPRIERMIPYIRDSFWSDRSFSKEEINRQAIQWCLRVAGARDHGTTHKQPLTLFRLSEQKALKPLPVLPFEIVTWHQAKVALDCHIQVSRTLYSVPYQYVGKRVDVKLGSKVVEIYLDSKLIKTHPRGSRGQRVTDWNDYPPEKAVFFQRTPAWYRQQASLIGSSTRHTVDTLLGEHALHYLRQCQGILRLKEKFTPERLERACARANAFGDPSYRTVRTILERELDQQALLFEPERVSGAFLRGPDELCNIIKK